LVIPVEVVPLRVNESNSEFGAYMLGKHSVRHHSAYQRSLFFVVVIFLRGILVLLPEPAEVPCGRHE
jgi:hypothetical protein